jgi:transcriptional regulator with XRE-family HTH domain
MKDPNNSFGVELRRLRKDAGYTQSVLAEKAGNISASYISQLEAGDKIPTPRIIRKLSGPLGVQPNDLFRLIGVVEMDLAGTLANKRNLLREHMHGLSGSHLDELASYLTYLEFKTIVFSSKKGTNFELMSTKPVMTAGFKNRHCKKSKRHRIRNKDSC